MEAREMPRFKSHKKVWALQIGAVAGTLISPADKNFAPFTVGTEFIQRHRPERGGYYVVYEDGYKSYSPKEPFESGYTLDPGRMSFGEALDALRQGKKVARAGWNGKGMWLELIKGREYQIHNHDFGPINEYDHDWRERVPQLLPWIGMKTADNKFVPWLASQTDMLADDWGIF